MVGDLEEHLKCCGDGHLAEKYREHRNYTIAVYKELAQRGYKFKDGGMQVPDPLPTDRIRIVKTEVKEL